MEHFLKKVDLVLSKRECFHKSWYIIPLVEVEISVVSTRLVMVGPAFKTFLRINKLSYKVFWLCYEVATSLSSVKTCHPRVKAVSFRRQF